MGKVAFSDIQNLYSEAQAITSTGNTDSTNTIDQLAAGDAYVANFLVVRVDTTFTSGGAGTLAVNLVTSDAADFGSGVKTFPIVAATALAGLTTGTNLHRGRLPLGLLRYRKLVYVVGTAAMTAGKVDAVEVTDVATNRM